MRTRTVTFLFICALAACSQSGGPVVPPGPGAAYRGTEPSLRISIRIPKHRRRHGRGDRYVSASTRSIAIAVYNAAHTKFVRLVVKNVTPVSEGCVTPSGGATTCTFSVPLAAGSYTADITAYDTIDSGGHRLSGVSDFPFTVKKGKRNALAFTLGGVAASIAIVAPNVPQVTGSQSTGFAIFNSLNTPLPFIIVAKDADGNMIVGAGAPSPAVSLLPSPAVVAIGSPAPGSNRWTLTPKATTSDPRNSAATFALSVKASPIPGTGGTTVTASPNVALNQSWFYVANCSGGNTVLFDNSGHPKTPSPGFGSSGANYGITYDSNNGWIYLVSEAAAVHAYDRVGNAQTLSGGFSGINYPAGILYDPHNQTIYMVGGATAQFSGGAGFGYDESGNTTVSGAGTFANLNGPFGMAFDSHNDLIYVANYGAGTAAGGVTVYDETGAQKTGTFPGTSAPESIAYDPDNNVLYVANFGSGSDAGSVTAYNENGTAHSTPAGSFSNVNEPGGIAFNPYDHLLYVVNYGSNVTTIYDKQGNEQTALEAGFNTSGGVTPGLNGPIAIAIVSK